MLIHRRVTPSSKFAGTHLYTWVERGTMGVKCLAQEHNTVPRPGLKPGPFDPESRTLTIRPPRLPQIYREHFSIECCKTKTKVITTGNQNKEKCHKKSLRTQSTCTNTCNQPEEWENASDQGAIGFSFTFDWLRGWHKFSKPITERSKAKPMQSQITFDTQLKIALIGKQNRLRCQQT